MSDDDPTVPVSEASPDADAKHAFFAKLDGRLAAAGYAVSPPAPAPPPPPALTFEAWAELSVRFKGAPPGELAGALAARGLTIEVWKRFDAEYRRGLSDDLRAAKLERPALYQSTHSQEQARRAGSPVPPLDGPPALPVPWVAPAALSGTAQSPELAAAVLELVGRMPFVPPAPEPAPAAQGKPAAKTVQSKAVPNKVGGQTMALDSGVFQRPTPTMPFAGGAGDAGVLYVPTLDARRYVSLQVELWFQTAPREETLSRYYVPNEAALRALDEQWRHPAWRAELETALADFAGVLRSLVLR